MQRNISVNLGNLLLSLSEIMDLANPVLMQHQQRTAFIAWEIAKVAALSEEQIARIFLAALLHDIGAVTIEEKIAVHDFAFEHINVQSHCVKGELLLGKVPRFRDIAAIVKYHHKKWEEWDETIETQHVLASQIITLADHVERFVDRKKYILHHNFDIKSKIGTLSGSVVHSDLVDCFMAAADSEEFWLDLVSPRLYAHLLHHGPYWDIEIDFAELFMIAELVRLIVDFKSRFTATHSAGVAASAEMLSRLFGFTEHETQLMKLAGDFHDIGKLIVPNSILEKPDKLTNEEFSIMKCHTYYTFHVLDTIGGIRHIAEWAAYHHERLDSSGYPFRCKPDEVSTGSRIMTVADIFTATAEDRPYRKGMSKDEIFKIMSDMASKQQIEAKIISLLFDNYDEISSYMKEAQTSAREFYENQFV
jgi:HD-GYP domain-containing protein (c-di-GMP phosphodiesterase class II)